MSLLMYLTIPMLLVSAHYVGIRSEIKSRKYLEIAKSISAGTSIAYVFIFLIPEVIAIGIQTQIETMIFTLFGFVFFHAITKYIFRTKTTKEHKQELIDEVHLATVGIYNFLIAFVIVQIINKDPEGGVFITFLLILHTVLTEITQKEMLKTHINVLKLPITIVLSFTGATLAIIELENIYLTALLFSLSSGAIIYIAIREELPQDSNGKPIFFVFGALITTLLLLSV